MRRSPVIRNLTSTVCSVTNGACPIAHCRDHASAIFSRLPQSLIMRHGPGRLKPAERRGRKLACLHCAPRAVCSRAHGIGRFLGVRWDSLHFLSRRPPSHDPSVCLGVANRDGRQTPVFRDSPLSSGRITNRCSTGRDGDRISSRYEIISTDGKSS